MPFFFGYAFSVGSVAALVAQITLEAGKCSCASSPCSPGGLAQPLSNHEVRVERFQVGDAAMLAGAQVGGTVARTDWRVRCA